MTATTAADADEARRLRDAMTDKLVKQGSVTSPHVHEDHVYVATTANIRPVREPEHQVRWFAPADIAMAPWISEDSQLLAAELLALAAEPGPQFRWLSVGRAVRS